MKQYFTIFIISFVLLSLSIGFTYLINNLSKVSAQLPDNKTDSNPPMNYTGKLENMIGKRIVPGQEDELRKTIGNDSLYNKPGFNASKPIETVDKHYSQLPSIKRGQPLPGGT